jgi:hypothetical protein
MKLFVKSRDIVAPSHLGVACFCVCCVDVRGSRVFLIIDGFVLYGGTVGLFDLCLMFFV